MKLSHNVLYNIVNDPYEEHDLSSDYPDVNKQMADKVLMYDAIIPEKEVLPFGVGQEGFVPPKEWNIFAPNAKLNFK